MHPWHALLAPLPPHFEVHRRPVAPPTLASDPAMAAIAGWEALTVELPAGSEGMRHLLVVLDAAGVPISAGDHVLTIRDVSLSSQTGIPPEYVHESLGGRLEPGGVFNGTRWHLVGAPPAEDEPGELGTSPVAQSRKPTATEVESLKALVADIIRRASEKRAPSRA